VPRRLIVFALGALCVTGCARRETGGGAPGADGGTLVVATPGDADLLLPPVMGGGGLAAHVTEKLFPKLADLTLSLNTVDDSGFTPVLARRWEHRDSLTIVFHLDPRARWTDGVPVTADDVVYTFGVYRDPRTGSPFRVNLDPIASVTKEDSLTVAFHFRRWYPEQLYDATYHLRMIPKHVLDTIPDDSLAASAFAKAPTVTAGPFRFSHWDSGTEIAVTADPAWFLGRPHLDRIVWRVMPDVSAAVSALLAGEADAMEVIPQRDEIERALRSPDLQLIPYPSPFLGGLLFNLRRPPFNDPAVRRAIAKVIDRETIVRSVFGPYGEVPVGAASRMMWIAAGTVRQPVLDTAGAARLLDSLGWRRGDDGIRRRGGRRLAFRVLTPTTSRIRQDVAVLVQDELQKVGIAMDIQPLEYAVFDARTRAGDFEAMMFSRTLDPSPAILGQFWGSRAVGADNLGGYASPAFDSLFAAASAAPSRPAAEPLWHAALERLNDDAPAVWIYSPRNNAAVHRRFEHVTIRPDSWLATVAAWSVAPDRRLPRDRTP
jgi:peptide/nickel transport system substrate-binding protein